MGVAKDRLLRRVLGATSLLVLAVTGCSAGAHSDRHTAKTPLPPLPVATARHLPAGVFYFAAGSNYASYDVWQVSNTGRETQLTHTPHNLGITLFGASPAGIVMADYEKDSGSMADWVDDSGSRLARLTSHGDVYVKNGGCDEPFINASGEVLCSAPTYDSDANPTGSDLLIKGGFNLPARVADHASGVNTGYGWGPHGSMVVLDIRHYPGHPGPPPKLATISKVGKMTTLHLGLAGDVQIVVSSERTGAIAISTGTETAVTFDGGLRWTRLPAGWSPRAWDPTGTALLVEEGGRELGTWSPARPGAIQLIGAIAKAPALGQIYWLASPAKL
jgi:hypothetical protein